MVIMYLVQLCQINIVSYRMGNLVACLALRPGFRYLAEKILIMLNFLHISNVIAGFKFLKLGR